MIVSRMLLILSLVMIAAQAPSLQSVAWLHGCWQMRGNGRIVEERWTAPAAGHMMGTGRTIRGDSLVEYEQIILRIVDGALAYEAHPSGQQPATFTARAATDTMVVFENPQHDFPQRVGYRKAGRDSLVAWVEGTVNGRTRRPEFRYARMSCDL